MENKQRLARSLVTLLTAVPIIFGCGNRESNNLDLEKNATYSCFTTSPYSCYVEVNEGNVKHHGYFLRGSVALDSYDTMSEELESAIFEEVYERELVNRLRLEAPLHKSL